MHTFCLTDAEARGSQVIKNYGLYRLRHMRVAVYGRCGVAETQGMGVLLRALDVAVCKRHSV